MTEAEWLAATDPMPMLKFLRGRISQRKVRLFAVACARLMLDRLQPHLREAIEAGERIADGLTDVVVDVPLCNKFAAVGVDFYERTGLNWRAESSQDDVAAHFAGLGAVGSWEYDNTEPYGHRWQLVARCQPDRQAALLRDLIGNPGRAGPLDPCWRTSTVLALAEGIYTDRAFDRLPILADALQDAGCDHPDFLAHCRGDGPHARGCWVVDLLLGKE